MFILTETPKDKVNYIVTLTVFAGKAPNYFVLLKEQDGQFYLPSCPVESDSTSIVSAGKLLFELTGVIAKTGSGNCGWEDLILAGVNDHPDNIIDGERYIYINYGIRLPATTIGSWVQLDKLGENPNLFEFIINVGRKL